MKTKRDHGGGLDAAIIQYGGPKGYWIDLSTGINPESYPATGTDARDWATLPDETATSDLLDAARNFWQVPAESAILAAPGLSALITRLPTVLAGNTFDIVDRTYNEYSAAFTDNRWVKSDKNPAVAIHVHPNNPNGELWSATPDTAPMTIIDESFCDTRSELSRVNLCAMPGTLVLKSFGKFWGLAGLRLGFAIGQQDTIDLLSQSLGPWPVSGPALSIGTRALQDHAWAEKTRKRLEVDASRMDRIFTEMGAKIIGGTTLFRLYQVNDAEALQSQLAKSQIWTRIFPYSKTWIRIGMPAQDQWRRLENAV